MRDDVIYRKGVKIIQSCKTKDQLQVAQRWIVLIPNKLIVEKLTELYHKKNQDEKIY